MLKMKFVDFVDLLKIQSARFVYFVRV